MGDIFELRERIFESDNRACFIERERILSELQKVYGEYTGEDKYAKILAALLERVSAPVEACDFFGGRAVEALPDEGMSAPSFLLCSTGHMSFDYEKLLKVGLRGMLRDIDASAKRLGDPESLSFADNAKTVVYALKAFAERYALSAQKAGKTQMAEALKKVPFEPAFDFYSALQSVWFVHFVASCYVGSRDYAFGRFDRYMFPFYREAINKGSTKEELTRLLAGFLIKTNEIAGRTTHNHKSKPVLCQASKQYVNIGGSEPNEFSSVVLKAAEMSCMPQPQIVVLLDPGADVDFTRDVFESLSVLTDKMNIYNYGQLVSAAVKKGIPKEVAEDFTYSACCTYDLNYRSYRLEYYVPVLNLFLDTLEKKTYDSVEEILGELKTDLQDHLQKHVDGRKYGYSGDHARREYVLDGIMLSESAANCRYPCQCSSDYNVLNVFFPGIATMGDSLSALDRFVFREKRYSYAEFMAAVRADFVSHESLRTELLGLTRFGNDSETDEYAVRAGQVLLDAADSLDVPRNFFVVPGFYSLERDNSWKDEVGATPDGRRRGEPFSENQSPSYGADKNGITALLKSVSKLPFDRAFGGGLNLTFSKNLSPENYMALVTGYFRLGGQHVGISVLDRDTLKDAMENPEKYKSLTVRLYGFSEYFISLPQWQQLAVLNRTEYGG